jgi:hypothetical protein
MAGMARTNVDCMLVPNERRERAPREMYILHGYL